MGSKIEKCLPLARGKRRVGEGQAQSFSDDISRQDIRELMPHPGTGIGGRGQEVLGGLCLGAEQGQTPTATIQTVVEWRA